MFSEKRDFDKGLYADIEMLGGWAPRVLELGAEADKRDLQSVLLLGESLEASLSEGGGLWPQYLRALSEVSRFRGSLLYLDKNEVEELIPEPRRKPLSWWGLHFTELYDQSLVPWSRTLGITPAEMYARLGEVPSGKLFFPI